MTASDRETLQVQANARWLARSPAERQAAKTTATWRIGPAPEPAPEPPPPNPVMTLNEVASLMHVTRQTVYNWIRFGRVKSLRTPSGCLRVERASLKTSC